MYFEPPKKTYYRFPSSNSISHLDLRYYFPEKPHATGENLHYETKAADYDSANHDPSIF